MPRKPTPEEPEYYAEKMPNGWSVNLYGKHLAEQDVIHHVSRLVKALEEVQKSTELLKKVIHRASKYGELSDEQLFTLTAWVHRGLCVTGYLDIGQIVQEEEEKNGPGEAQRS